MPVTYLELENFKSYSGIQKIGPFHNFTSVIGPNGSGKSNLMDAISFVLGVSSRNLRSSQLKDLIFRPPGDDDDNDSHSTLNESDPNISSDDESSESDTPINKGGRKASASLIYLDTDTNIETRFSRTISQNGVSKYKINHKTVSFAQYEKHLSTIGVILKGRNFLVFQGDVESTARKSPKELTTWFEDISNSIEFKEDYEQAYTEMTHAENNARLTSQKLKGFYKQKRELKAQKEEADKFQLQLETKAKLLTEFFLWQMYHVKCDIEEKEEVIDGLNQEMEEVNAVVAVKMDELRKEKKDASKARSAASKLEKERVTLAAEVDQAQPSAIKTKEEIKNLKKKLSSEEKKLEKIKNDNESRAETIEKLEHEIKEYSETESELKNEYEETKLSRSNARGGVTLSEEQEAEYDVVREAAAVASVKPRQALNIATRQLESARAKSAALGEEVKELKVRKQEATNRFNELIERKDTLQKSVEKTKSDLKEGKTELQNVQRLAQEDEEKRKTIDLELEQINHKLLELRDDRRVNQHEARLEEAMASLKRYFPGVKDRLVKLCQPTQKRFDLAVTVAGGKDMDAVVVDTKQTAADCIQYLRSNQIGTATFLPLDSLQVPNPESTERIRSMIEQDSRFRLTYDVIACDDSVKKAVLYAVGNSVVCDDLDCARELCFSPQNRRNKNEEARIKAVTLGGAVISKAGTMTGGISNEERSKAGRWDDREVQRLRTRKEELESELSKLDEARNAVSQGNRRSSRGGHNYRIEELRNAVGNLTNRLQYSNSDLEFTSKKVKEQETLISSISTQLDNVEKKMAGAESQIEKAQAKVQAAAEEVKSVEEVHYASFLEKTGLKDFHAYDESVGKAREDYFKKVGIIRQHLEKLKAQKLYEEGRDIDSTMRKNIKTVENIKKKLESAQAREAKIVDSVAEAKTKLADVETKLEQAREDEVEREDNVRNAQTDYKAIQQDLAKLSKTLNNEESYLERLRAKQHETLQMARVEEADLPLADESNAETSTQLSNKIDYSSLRRDLKQRRNDRETLKIQKKFEDEIDKVKQQIETMAPNMRAGEAFDSVVDQVDECSEDLTKAKNIAREAARKFEDIKRQRADRFNSAFEHIATSLTQIYKDMTMSSKHPLGGKAYLNLSDKEEPYNGTIDFNAMPPMKRFRGMEYLSGGEKTIAALALLFAIHSYHPAPFFVMDEVDAALDNINVLKLCNYIKQRSVDFQCIVISLKDMFYEQSKSLVGICRDVKSNSSRTLTLDLSKFDHDVDNANDDDNNIDNISNNIDGSTSTDKKRRRISSLEPRKRTTLSPEALSEQ